MDGKVISSATRKVSVPANSSAMVYRESVAELLGETLPEDAYARFTFTDAEGCRYGNMRFFSNQKDVRFMQPDIKWEVTDRGDCKEVRIVSDVFARAVYLSVKDSDILHFSDNFIDLYPGEEYVVTVKTDMPAEELAERLQYNTVNAFLYY
jgi:beta-mannosidase